MNAESPASTKKPWYKKWWVWLLAALGLLIIVGALTSDPNVDDAASASASTTLAEAAAPTTDAPTTTQASTTTATEATTTTAEATTTTSGPDLSDPETAAVLFLLQFEAARDNVIEVLEDNINVETVDKYVAEVEDEDVVTSLRVILDITSGWASESNQVDGAWEVTRAYAVLYGDEGPFFSEAWMPAFDFTNSGTKYLCTGEFMGLLGDSRKSRADWESEC